MFARLRGWHLAAGLVSVAIIVVTVQAAFAATQNKSGLAISHVKVVSNTGAVGGTAPTAGGPFVPVPNATRTFKLGAGKSAILLMSFNAESVCTGPASLAEACSVRIMVGTTEADPAGGASPHFDSPVPAPVSAAHSIDRSLVVAAPLSGPKTFTIQVQYAMTTGVTSFALNNWSLTAERVDQ
jgi:hypothetical protein